jgi:cell fate (sporulation/competence/biofilm development) regulator YmcA (YheA/YmcA/DUF963 family)
MKQKETERKLKIDSIVTDILKQIPIIQEYDSSLRKGQILSNIVTKMFSLFAQEIDATTADCFYDDKKIDLYISKLKEWLRGIVK